MSDKKTYTDSEVTAKLQELGLTDWYLEDGWIRRKYNTDGWPQTLMAVNAIGYLCEAAYHHADLAVTWGKLWVKLKTHSAGGITDKDFEVAKKIEEVVLWRPAGGALDRQPQEVRVQQVVTLQQSVAHHNHNPTPIMIRASLRDPGSHDVAARTGCSGAVQYRHHRRQDRRSERGDPLPAAEWRPSGLQCRRVVERNHHSRPGDQARPHRRPGRQAVPRVRPAETEGRGDASPRSQAR